MAPDGPLAVQEGVLAVLPFNNLGPTGDLDWFAVAVTELLATTMANSPMVDVISPERMRLILDSPADGPLDALGLMANSNVGYSITGSILGGGAGIRVESSLVDNLAGTPFCPLPAGQGPLRERQLGTGRGGVAAVAGRGVELDAGQAGPALAEFGRVREISPGFIEAHFDLARAHLLAGSEADAKRELELYLAEPGEGSFVEEAREPMSGLD